MVAEKNNIIPFDALLESIEGELFTDNISKTIYATDASVYQELPLGVVYPKSNDDLKSIVQFAAQHRVALIPRAGGTSLAGQCVGSGLVVDVSRYLDKIISFDTEKQEITVQPGIIRDQVNFFLQSHDLFFAPITSTANRATIGGMVGNNSCGTNSIVYGNTRKYVKSVKALLSDGSEVVFGDLTKAQFEVKMDFPNLEGQLYRHIYEILSKKEIRQQIIDNFPKKNIHRRNTGYALDELMSCDIFTNNEQPFNFCKLIAGSEGTLVLMTEITIKLCPLPPKKSAVLICHFHTIQSCLGAVKHAMTHQPFFCEMMDKTVLDCTKANIKYRKSMTMFEGEPQGVLLVEFRNETTEAAIKQAEELQKDLTTRGFGYDFNIITNEKTKEIWQLRSAGLGLLANIPGDAKAVACIEDTSVAIEDLADYIQEFTEMMKEFGQDVVYYAHAGAGELHLRPKLDLKQAADQEKFYKISFESAKLVKKYGGSLSGEHGDGRVRAPFIPLVVGEKNYQLFENIKTAWDPHNIFNPHKIVQPKPMTESLRYTPDQVTPDLKTLFDFSSTGGILRMTEKCNGSGDCRKLPSSGGTMCPSYQATRNERHTTRARANVLRHFLTKNTTPNPFNHHEIKEILDLCISCKGCTSECPSNIDMSTLKAEFLHQYYQSNPLPFRTKIFANIASLNAWGSRFPRLMNFFFKNKFTSNITKKILSVAPQRTLPLLSRQTLRKWYKKNYSPHSNQQKVYLFCDEFTNYNESHIGIKTIQLLDKLGYAVCMVEHPESGRAAISKGVLKKAQKNANRNVEIFSELIDNQIPLIGIEPSAILSFRDEYPKLVSEHLREKAQQLSENCFLIEEFLAKEIRNFRITSDHFNSEEKHLLVHGHCHQKALSEMSDVFTVLSLPTNFQVKILETGCCGMAGSFGYEAEHYEVSMKIAELTLFPSIRKRADNQIIIASGTSCRHQILDGLALKALHPVEVLHESLVP